MLQLSHSRSSSQELGEEFRATKRPRLEAEQQQQEFEQNNEPIQSTSKLPAHTFNSNHQDSMEDVEFTNNESPELLRRTSATKSTEKVRSWEGNKGKPKYKLKHSLTGHKKSISTVKFSSDGKWLASACTSALFTRLMHFKRKIKLTRKQTNFIFLI